MQIAHILVPTDFGEHAERAVEVGATFASRFGAKLTLLHVAHVSEYAYGQRTAQSLDDLLPKAQDALDEAAARARSRCDDVEGVLAQGRPCSARPATRAGDLFRQASHHQRPEGDAP